MSNAHLEAELIALAHKMADAARLETLRFFRTDQQNTDNKDTSGGFDPVTRADRNAEQVMREIIQQYRPDDGIIGEEFGVKTGTSDLTWVFDPIDGTRAYICGATSWGVLISIERNNTPIFGLIDQPYTSERFQGGFGKSELLMNSASRALQTRSCASLSDAVLVSTYPEVGSDAERVQFEKVSAQAKLTRYGLDCYGYALLALGQVDLVIEAGLKKYDVSAPSAIVRAAGGIVTDWQGNDAIDGGQVIAASDIRVHAQAVERLNS